MARKLFLFLLLFCLGLFGSIEAQDRIRPTRVYHTAYQDTFKIAAGDTLLSKSFGLDFMSAAYVKIDTVGGSIVDIDIDLLTSISPQDSASFQQAFSVGTFITYGWMPAKQLYMPVGSHGKYRIIAGALCDSVHVFITNAGWTNQD